MYAGVGNTTFGSYGASGYGAFGELDLFTAVAWSSAKLKAECQHAADGAGVQQCRLDQTRNSMSAWSKNVEHLFTGYLKEGVSTDQLRQAIAKEVMYPMSLNEAYARLDTILSRAKSSLAPAPARALRTLPQPQPQQDVESSLPSEEAEPESDKPNYLLYGGIAVVALGVGALVWKTQKKKR